jgi:hypothetical protein
MVSAPNMLHEIGYFMIVYFLDRFMLSYGTVNQAFYQDIKAPEGVSSAYTHGRTREVVYEDAKTRFSTHDTISEAEASLPRKLQGRPGRVYLGHLQGYTPTC